MELQTNWAENRRAWEKSKTNSGARRRDSAASHRGIPPPVASLIDFSVMYRRLGRMGSTTKHPRLDRSDISTSAITITIFQGRANRPPSVALERLYAIRMTDLLARKRFVNMADRLGCQDELGSIGRHASSAIRCLQRDMIDSGRWETQPYAAQNGR